MAQSNMNLASDYYGSSEVNGMPIYTGNAGVKTIGLVLDSTNTADAVFGASVCSMPATPEKCVVGAALSGGIIRGFIKANQGITENFPTRSNIAALNGGQITVMTQGTATFYGVVDENAVASKLGQTVHVNRTTGEIIATSTVSVEGYVPLTGVAKIVSVNGNCYEIEFNFPGAGVLS